MKHLIFFSVLFFIISCAKEETPTPPAEVDNSTKPEQPKNYAVVEKRKEFPMNNMFNDSLIRYTLIPCKNMYYAQAMVVVQQHTYHTTYDSPVSTNWIHVYCTAKLYLEGQAVMPPNIDTRDKPSWW